LPKQDHKLVIWKCSGQVTVITDYHKSNITKDFFQVRSFNDLPQIVASPHLKHQELPVLDEELSKCFDSVPMEDKWSIQSVTYLTTRTWMDRMGKVTQSCDEEARK
jgi:hypothetical protein